MATLQLKPHLSVTVLKQRMQQESDVRFFQKWQILNAVANHAGIKADTIALMLGTTTNVVRRSVQLYNQQGADFMQGLQWGGRREQRSILSLAEERLLLKSIEAKAMKGAILTAKEIKKEVENKVKREVSEDYLWDLFKRHGWKKKAPRPKHPKQDLQAQDVFKKNSPKQWHPSL